MTKIGVIQFLLLFLVSAAFGQKVKYKDIYALLSVKQFEQAEPFLKQYLRETADNPNAFLFMGNIYQEKASKNDVLRQTAIAVANMDSAIFYYDKTRKTLDDREVRKNKEYYEAYNRRDLRTGEFGVKLSDIQFDIDKKIESLKERIDGVKMVRHFFSIADTTYARSVALYVSLQQKYPSLHQLYLRADQSTLKDLETLAVRFDSCRKAFDHYKSASSSLGKTGYHQKLAVKDIIDFHKDGAGRADFYADEVVVWDYKKFAEGARELIEKEVLPLRSHLVTYDIEINKLREKLQTDSVSVRSDLTTLIDKLVYDQLKKFDPAPLPTIVFAMKTTDLAYRSMQLEHKPLRDSADIHLQIRMISEELKLLAELDSAAHILSDDQLSKKSIDYADFITRTYSGPSVLQSYLRGLREYGAREQQERTSLLDGYRERLKYIIDGVDSIPLLAAEEIGPFKPLVVDVEKFTLGVSSKDTTQLQGYFYTITASRTPDVKAYFPVDKTLTLKQVNGTHGLAYADAGGQIYYVLIYGDQPVKDRYPATLAKVYRSDGLAWKMDQALPFTPAELVVSTDTGEVLIKNGDLQVVVDKNGKVR